MIDTHHEMEANVKVRAEMETHGRPGVQEVPGVLQDALIISAAGPGSAYSRQPSPNRMRGTRQLRRRPPWPRGRAASASALSFSGTSKTSSSWTWRIIRVRASGGRARRRRGPWRS
ncbi:MAG: hypothetical protein MZU95_12955 [Desulfomicrobium escambiense]|nr:hypothetical protein [Desulfomicrobium escambiense]